MKIISSLQAWRRQRGFKKNMEVFFLVAIVNFLMKYFIFDENLLGAIIVSVLASGCWLIIANIYIKRKDKKEAS